jgi:hypothetical protein
MAQADIASGSVSQLWIITISPKNGPSVMIGPGRIARPFRIQGPSVYETGRERDAFSPRRINSWSATFRHPTGAPYEGPNVHFDVDFAGVIIVA